MHEAIEKGWAEARAQFGIEQFLNWIPGLGSWPAFIYILKVGLALMSITVGYRVYQNYRKGRPLSQGCFQKICPPRFMKSPSLYVHLTVWFYTVIGVSTFLRAFCIGFFTTLFNRVDLLFSKAWLLMIREPIHVYLWGLSPTLRLTLTALMVFLAMDFGYYVGHWCCHHMGFLWRFHRVHHRSTHLNIFAYIRIHPIDDAFMNVCVAGALAFTAFLLPELRTSSAERDTFFLLIFMNQFGYLLHSLAAHSTVSIRWGWLEYLVLSPGMHQAHHARDLKRQRSNLGLLFPFCDLLFGTFYRAHKGELLLFGSGEGKEPATVVEFYLSPFLERIEGQENKTTFPCHHRH